MLDQTTDPLTADLDQNRYMENVRARQRQMVKWRQKLKKPLCPQPNAKGNDEWRAARVQPADNVPHHRRHSWPIKQAFGESSLESGGMGMPRTLTFYLPTLGTKSRVG
ncbi:hypothetical protein SCA6_005625 [Theobroma cacao]